MCIIYLAVFLGSYFVHIALSMRDQKIRAAGQSFVYFWASLAKCSDLATIKRVLGWSFSWVNGDVIIQNQLFQAHPLDLKPPLFSKISGSRRDASFYRSNSIKSCGGRATHANAHKPPKIAFARSYRRLLCVRARWRFYWIQPLGIDTIKHLL